MAVDEKTKGYDKARENWDLIRTCKEGEKAVKSLTTKFLQPRAKEPIESSSYKAYVHNASYFNVLDKTISTFLGYVFRKDASREGLENKDGLLDDVSLSGLSLDGLAQEVVSEMLTVGRAGIFVDSPYYNAEEISKAEQKSRNLTPYLKIYTAESIIGWESSIINNRYTITQIRLMESVTEKDPKDEFKFNHIEQIRVLDLDEEGFYRQRVYQKGKDQNNKDQWVLIKEPIYPVMDGQKMTYIPFIFIGLKNNLPTIDKPPFLDLTNLSLSAYRTNADLSNLVAQVSSPVLALNGYEKEQMTQLSLGAGAVIANDNVNSSAQWLTVDAGAINSLRELEKGYFEQMSVSGANFLNKVKNGVESFDTIMVNKSGEVSELAALANNVSKAITEALKIMFKWAGISENEVDKISYNLNTEFFANVVTQEDIDMYTKLILAGMSTEQEVRKILQDRGALPELTEDEFNAQKETSDLFAVTNSQE